MATWLNIPKDKITQKEINDIFDNSPKHFYLKWFDGTKHPNYYEVEIRHAEGMDIKKEFYKELERRREQPTNIRLGDKFIFDNKPYEVYHIREQHDPKIYLGHITENGIRDELTYYQSDIVKALKENKIEMIDERKLIENEVTNHDIIKMWADKPEQNKEFNLSDFLADVKANFSAEEKAYLRERLLINFRQNEFSPIIFQKNSNISKEGIEKVENFYNKFKQENYTPVSEKDLKEYGFNYASIYVDKNFENKVDDILKAMHYDENIRTEINEVYLNIKKNIHTENSVNQEQKDLFKNLNNIDEKAREIIESWYEHTEKVGFDFPSSEEFKKDLEAKTSYTFEIDNYGQPTNLKLKNKLDYNSLEVKANDNFLAPEQYQEYLQELSYPDNKMWELEHIDKFLSQDTDLSKLIEGTALENDSKCQDILQNFNKDKEFILYSKSFHIGEDQLRGKQYLLNVINHSENKDVIKSQLIENMEQQKGQNFQLKR